MSSLQPFAHRHQVKLQAIRQCCNFGRDLHPIFLKSIVTRLLSTNGELISLTVVLRNLGGHIVKD